MNKIIYTEQLLQEAASKSNCYSQMFRFLGARIGGNTYQRIKYLINKYCIDVSHFLGKNAGPINAGINTKKKWEERLRPNIEFRLKSREIRRALQESGAEYICEKCKLKPEWQGQKLTLQVDHINGNWRDCRKENLRFLCPNCHSQAPTFCNQGNGKKCCNCGAKVRSKSKWCKRCSPKFIKYHTKVKQKPDKNKLLELIWSMPTTEVAKIYGICDKSVEKWCKKYEISKPPRGYWQKQKRF